MATLGFKFFSLVLWGLGHKNFPINTLCTFGNWHLLFLFSSRQVAKIRPKKKKRWTPGLLWGYWFRVWSPSPKTLFLHTEQVYIALEKSLHRQTEGQREGGRAFACFCGELRVLKSGPVFSTFSTFLQSCVWEEIVNFSFLFCGV
jgi:hypothetical protein